MLRKLRLTLAVLFFMAVTLLFLDFTGTVHKWLGWTAEIQFLPALLALNVVVVLVLVAVTLLVGRVYCSVICPLGVMQDIIAWLGRLGGKKRKLRYSHSPERRWLRWGVFVAFVACLVGGLTTLSSLLAPYSSYALPPTFFPHCIVGATMDWLMLPNASTAMLFMRRMCG